MFWVTGREVLAMMKALLGLAAVAVFIGGCSVGPGRPAPGATGARSADPAPATTPQLSASAGEAPVDRSLPAESRSNLSVGATVALQACGLLDNLDLVS